MLLFAGFSRKVLENPRTLRGQLSSLAYDGDPRRRGSWQAGTFGQLLRSHRFEDRSGKDQQFGGSVNAITRRAVSSSQQN